MSKRSATLSSCMQFLTVVITCVYGMLASKKEQNSVIPYSKGKGAVFRECISERISVRTIYNFIDSYRKPKPAHLRMKLTKLPLIALQRPLYSSDFSPYDIPQL